MANLVDKPQSSLSERATSRLVSLIKISEKKQKPFFDSIDRDRDLLKGDHWKNIKQASREEVKMVINLAHAHVRSLLPTIFFKQPTVTAIPPAPIYDGKQATWNAVLNNTLEKIAFADVIKKVTLDAVVFPEGVFKWVLNAAPDDEEGQRKETETDTRGSTVWLDKGSPVPIRVRPSDLIVDYLAPDRDLSAARFVAIRYKKTRSELRAHPIYGKHLEELEKSDTSLQLRRPVTFTSKDDVEPISEEPEELFTIYEVWINELVDEDHELKLRRQMCVVMEEAKKPIRPLQSWDELLGEGWNEYPIHRLVLNEVPDDIPVSELSLWHSLQVAINWLVSRVVKLVESERMLYAVRAGGIKNFNTFREKFLNSGRIVDIIEVTDNPDATIRLLQPTFAGRDNYALLGQIMGFIQQVSGFGQNRRGGQGIRTATEAELIEVGTQIKTDEKVETLKKFLNKVITQLAKLIRILVKRSGDTSFVFRIGGDTGTINWLEFTKEELDWLPEIIIDSSSFRKADSAAEMQKIAGVITMALQIAQLNPQIRIDKLFTMFLERAGIPEPGKIVGNQDEESLLQMVEIAGMIAGVPTPVLPNQNHIAHIQMLDAFENSDIFRAVAQSDPQIVAVLAQHRQEHEQALQQLQSSLQQGASGVNPFDDLQAQGNLANNVASSNPDRPPLPQGVQL